MESHISYYDVAGKLKEVTPPYGSERHSLTAHDRTVAAKMGAGSIAVFPPPHRYFFARDYTTNQGYLWYSSWRGRVGLGVQQYADDDTTIVTAVISMAQSLKLRVVAEGVETPEEFAFLQAHECDEGQGYYFSRPMPATQFATWAASGSWISPRT